MSGRLLSLVTDIRGDADRAAAQVANVTGLRFRALAYGKVEDLRKEDKLDVYVEPTNNDAAHANLVMMNEPPQVIPMEPNADPKITQDIFRDIQVLIGVCDEKDLDELEASIRGL